MFNFICGEIVSSENGIVVLKSNDIGFELNVSNATQKICEIGKQIQLFTYLQVKEDAFTLLGFSTQQEKNMFLQLITVSGVGPKMAISVLSGATTVDLANAILSGNTSLLCSIKGLGKKTAERLILELREKVSAYALETKSASLNADMQQAVAVLLSLGCSNADAVKRVVQAHNDGVEGFEELIRYALRMN